MHSLRLNRPQWGFVAALLRHEVRFVVIGGFAVSAYVSWRHPDDFDVLVEPTPENDARIEAALRDLGHPGVPPDKKGFFTRPKAQERHRVDGALLDIVTAIDDVTFDEAMATAVQVRVEVTEAAGATASSSVLLPVLGRQQLIRSKLKQAEPKHRRDIDALLEGE